VDALAEGVAKVVCGSGESRAKNAQVFNIMHPQPAPWRFAVRDIAEPIRLQFLCKVYEPSKRLCVSLILYSIGMRADVGSRLWPFHTLARSPLGLNTEASVRG
jgi:hypothetical protein